MKIAVERLLGDRSSIRSLNFGGIMNWLGFCLINLSYFLMEDEKRIRPGLLVAMLGNLSWMTFGIFISERSMVLAGTVASLLCFRSWYKWQKKDRYEQVMILPEYRRKWWQIWK